MKKNILIPITLTTLACLIACSNTKKVEVPITETSIQKPSSNNTIGFENDASWYTELNFKKGSAELKSEDYTELNDLVKKSQDSGSIREFKIISWSDSAYPGRNKKSLNKKQADLADLRNKNIKNYLNKAYPQIEVSLYSMAKRPNALQNLFETSDARTKKSIERAGIYFDHEHRLNVAHKESTALVLSILK